MKLNCICMEDASGRSVQCAPASGLYNNVVLWLHGLGETADDWAPIMEDLDLDDTKFILPTAKSRKVTFDDECGPIPAWSDVYGLTREDKEDRDGLDESAVRIDAIIEEEIQKGVRPSKVVVGGFSQGGAEALHAALRNPRPLGGVVALSTWLPLRADYPAALSPAARTLPILQVHGDHDENVEYPWGLESHDLLVDMKIKPEPQFVTIKDMMHGSGPEEMSIVKKFIQNIFVSPTK